MDNKILKSFISYSNEDEKYLELIVEGLKKHSKDSKIFDWNFWDDRKISIGENWYEIIEREIFDSNFALLLISANFLASRFIKHEEFSRFLEKNREEGFLIFPVLINHCNINKWEELTKIQFFKAKGSDYGFAKSKTITFADLVKFDSEGVLIPNANLEKYYMNLVISIEESINKRFSISKKIKSKNQRNNSNDNRLSYSEFTDGVNIEMKIDGNFDKLTIEQKERILQRVSSTLGIDVKSIKLLPGSIKVVIESNVETAEKIYKQLNDLSFEGYKLKSVSLINSEGILKHKEIRSIKVLTKRSLVESIAIEANLSTKDAKRALEAFVNTTSIALRKGDKVALAGFGSFSVNKRSARTGRNPQTGKPISIKAKKVIKFKGGSGLLGK